MENKIEETLLTPQVVIQSKTDSAVRMNYRFYHKTQVGGKWLCVVEKYTKKEMLSY